MKIEYKNGNPMICPTGRIDSNTAQSFLEEAEELLKDTDGKTIEINMEGVEFVSSAGLRTFMKMKKDGKDIRLTEVRPEVYDVFAVTGFTELLDIKKALRRISVDGCEVIGHGFYGTIYRIDEDTIVKVYESPDSIPMIENEQRMAKQAFLNGIPTAISYDVVRVGDSYGSVFELLKAKTFNDLIIEQPENADDIIKKYVEFLKLVHKTEMNPGSLPYAAQHYIEYLESIKDHLPQDQYDKLMGYLEQFPADEHVVHGDFQMKNVMLVDGEPMLIDMDTLSVGHPIFDLAGLYVAYRSFREDEEGNSMRFLGISDEMCEHIWQGIMNLYFEGKSERDKDIISDRIWLAASIRFLSVLVTTDLKNGELGATRIKHTREHISELLERVDGLYFDIIS
jgi:uncharacterized protein (TIGR02172 family)